MHRSWFSQCRQRSCQRQILRYTLFESSSLNWLQRREPCIFSGLTESWKAKVNWAPQHLLKVHGERKFSCGLDDTNDAILVTMDECINGETPLYIFDPAFDATSSELLQDYEIPPIFETDDAFSSLPNELKPDYRWFLVGRSGTGSRLHTDPCHTSAWNACIIGVKDWMIIKPSESAIQLEAKLKGLDFQGSLSAIFDARLLGGMTDITSYRFRQYPG